MDLDAIAELTTEEELEAASNDLEERRLAAHIEFKAEGLAIATRRSQIRAVVRVAAFSPEELAEIRKALAAAPPEVED